MTENQIKQAYVTGLAARGLLRQMYKQAAMQKQAGGMDVAKSYAKYTGAGAGLGAIIGTLIQIARQKNLMTGALVGAGIGGGIGAGQRGLNSIDAYRNSDWNLLEKGIFDPLRGAADKYLSKKEDA